eukprot:6491654-Pyramimonas_sp.AAC.1
MSYAHIMRLSRNLSHCSVVSGEMGGEIIPGLSVLCTLWQLCRPGVKCAESSAVVPPTANMPTCVGYARAIITIVRDEDLDAPHLLSVDVTLSKRCDPEPDK